MNSQGGDILTVFGIEFDLDNDIYRFGFWNKQTSGDFKFNYIEIDESDPLLVEITQGDFFPNANSYSARADGE